MNLRAFLALLAGAAIIAFAISWMLPLQALAASCSNMVASYYGAESGNRTANGEHFTGNEMTAASRTLPFSTRLRVTYHGKSVVVRINDRGPYVAGRQLDLSHAAARQIGLTHAGVATVLVCRLPSR